MTIYALKPRFQAMMRPIASALARAGVTANQVTTAAAAGSILIGVVTTWFAGSRTVFLVIPLWMFVRMALNAIDGMLAREFGQKSTLGGYLNEIGDVVSDAALYAPFALIAPFDAFSVALVVVLSTVTELAGALGSAVGAGRRYEGPMGKSDRAVLFGALGLWVGAVGPMPGWTWWLMPIASVLLVATVVNRIRAGMREAGA